MGRFNIFLHSADEDAWYAYVKAFEWATQAPDSGSLRGQIRARLVQEHGFQDGTDGDLACQRLFAVVFDRLCQRDIKRLSRAELLDALRNLPTHVDPTLFTELTGLHAALVERVEALEQGVRDLNRVVTAAVAQMGVLTHQAGITAVIDPRAVAAPPTTPPPRATHLTARAGTISALAATGQPRAIALHGGIMPVRRSSRCCSLPTLAREPPGSAWPRRHQPRLGDASPMQWIQCSRTSASSG